MTDFLILLATLVVVTAAIAIARRTTARRRAATPIAALTARDVAIAPRPDRYSYQRLRVLVVDDRALVGRQIARMLAAHDVTWVTSADEAQAAMTRARPGQLDAILYALAMPELSGFAFADLLSAQQPAMRTSLIFLLDPTPSSAMLRNIARAGVRWITKPLHYAALATAVDAAADAQRKASPAIAIPALASAA